LRGLPNFSLPIAVCEQEAEMRKHQQLGLDELMIVNPSASGTEAVFLGKDGTLYQLRGRGEEEALQGSGQFFLGEDGTLYQVQGFDAGSSTAHAERLSGGLGEGNGQELGHYFLGADGALYEVVR
jgi:hypothetical protein